MAVTLSRRSKFLAAGALAAVGLFAGGTALGYALNDPGEAAPDGGSQLAARPANGYQSPLDPYVRMAAQPESGSSDGAAAPPLAAQTGRGGDQAANYADSKMMPPYGLCQAPIGNLLVDGVVDLKAAGFAANLLRDGFVLTSLSVRSEGDCDDNFRAENGVLVVDSSWTHTETGFMVSVSQRVQAQRTANMLYRESAQFWDNGYQYNVWVNAYTYYPLSRDAAYVDPATDPRVIEVRDAAVAQLAPSIGAQCFFRQEPGAWSDLAALGIGDPRGAIPAGFTEAYSSIFRLVEPDASCPGADLEPQVTSGFNASYQLGNGEGWLEIGAWPVYEQGVTYPGYIDGYGSNWSNGKWQFSVYGNRANAPIGAETLEAVGRALDPQYNSQCFLKERSLTEGDLAGLGFHSPLVPEGYSVSGSNLRVSDVADGCDLDNVAAPNYYLNWTISNGDNVYDVNVSRGAPMEGVKFSASQRWISDYGVNWNDASGTYFSVSASSRGVTGIPDRDTLIAIAESLDPTLDVSKLSEDGAFKPYPVAVPESGASSGGAATP